METKTTLRLHASRPSDIDRASAMLREGATVGFPTETVYGLGANALLPEAVAQIFAAKQRPSWDPLIVHIASLADLGSVAVLSAELVSRVDQLAKAFWPGPLTLLLPRSAAVPDAITAGRALVGVRIPNHPIAQELLRRAAVPVAAPSANTFGHVSPTTAAHVLADLDGRIDAVLDGGPTSVGLESTVLEPATMTIYRPGAVTAHQLEAVTGVTTTLFAPPEVFGEPASLPSPGVGIRHYAPRARLQMVEGTEAALRLAAASFCKPGLGVLQPTGWANGCPKAHTFDWGNWTDPDALAANLFRGLRALDDAGATMILCPTPSSQGIGAALRDRLEKAARPR